ncbi:hypothetical protein [Paenibacillus hubeiensis]|uniref:hypothetical protein n=1 Tax=Paenibacillus hubeiensis TaxID=3077330 RepID=UPI0031BA3A98
MMETTVTNLIQIYMPKLEAARNVYPHLKVAEVLKEFSKKLKLLEDVEKEIEVYLKESIINHSWGRDNRLWFVAVLEKPSITYVKSLLEILKIQDASTPYWRALDVLAYMPQSISVSAVPELTQIIESNNPVWSDEILKKAFETLIWIRDKEGIEFISRACDSDIERISLMAKYWFNWLNEEDE